MANRGGQRLYIQRSLGCKFLDMRFHSYSSFSCSCVGDGAGALLSAGRSSEFLLNRHQQKSKRLVFGDRSGYFSICKAFIGRNFSSVHQTAAVRVERPPTPPIYLSPPVPLRSPWLARLAIRPRTGRPELGMPAMRARVGIETEAEAERDYYKFFSIADEKEYMMKKQIRGGWQRELLTPDKAICVGSSHGWLAFLHPDTTHLYLFNPFLSSSPEHAYIPLPSLQTIGFIKSVRAVKTDSLSPSSRLDKHFITPWDESMSSEEVIAEFHIRKFAMSTSPSNCNCTVVISYCGICFFCLPGRDDTCWTRCEEEGMEGECDYSEFVYFSKDRRFYSMLDFGQLRAFDLNDPSCPKTELIHYSSSAPDHYFRGERYLVECSGDLLLVCGLNVIACNRSGADYGWERFCIYRLDFDEHQWEPVNCLGENALFVGENHSFSLSARDHPELEPNSIYFTGHTSFKWKEDKDDEDIGLDNGVFNLKDHSTLLYYSQPNNIEPGPHWDARYAPNTIWVAPYTP